ncbi:MAG: 16S rRNA (guanine(966)-N(2))-methyltransferase RsmD [Pseudomonadota bacterium]
MSKRTHRPNFKPQTVRIIGGQWRGRRIGFPDRPGLRPTADRVRETLFNWLQPTISGVSCLDLFAGSGVLGLEAASRGADAVLMLDSNPSVVRHLKQQAALFNADQIHIVQADALSWLQTSTQNFDIIFLDPPFGQGVLARALGILREKSLSSETLIYLETEAALPVPNLPEDWEYLRDARAGAVKYYLARVSRCQS